MPWVCCARTLNDDDPCSLCGAPSQKARTARHGVTRNFVLGAGKAVEPGAQAEAFVRAHEQASALVAQCPPEAWVEFKLVDPDGRPVRGERILITLPDGTEVERWTRDDGTARVEHLVRGTGGAVTARYPDLAGGLRAIRRQGEA